MPRYRGTRPMNRRSLRLCLLWAASTLLPVPGLAACVIGKMAELPVRMVGLRALMPVKFNGSDSELVVDSGAFYSMLSPASAMEFKLKLSPTPLMRYVQGANGAADVSLATVDEFVLDTIPLKRVQFLVGGTDPGAGAAGLLGENLLGIADAEYDLSNGVIRLMKPMGCGSRPLAYWAFPAKLPIAMMSIEYTGGYAAHIGGTAMLNGHRIRVLFDTGAATSVLTLAAAKRAGVTPQSPGVVFGGAGFGVGRASFPTWVGPFASLKLGGEETRNTRLRFGALTLGDEDMLLGMDFFLSHHVYVANSQHKIYFTYNGGPVFNLASLRSPPSASQAQDESTQPHTAVELAARGRALVARRDFEQAIADLTRAARLDPTQPDYFYQRALAYLGEQQSDPARADLDHALKLNPDFADALLARARLSLSNRDSAAARTDLDLLDRTSAAEADQRLAMAMLYLGAQAAEQSTHQLDLWIASHGSDARLADALNERCWSRTMWDRDLDKAEADCKGALRLQPQDPNTLDSFGWVELRRGKYDLSIRQFDAALQRRPKLPASLYGRGIDELRLGKRDAGETDIAAAKALEPGVAERMRAWGISP
jgi:tetratricopeptide (TPR) repeat protein